MKSKFMRMVGRGVEDPEEEEQVEEVQMEEEQNKILPLISDVEIDGFYEKFLSTGFESPYIHDKRMYVLDVNSKLEEFLKKSDLTNKLLTGGVKKSKRLVGGVTAFDNILDEMKTNKLNKYLIDEGNKDFTKYTEQDIQEVISNLENGIIDYQNKNEEGDYTRYITLLNNFLNDLKSAQVTDVAPIKDILEEKQYEKAINEDPLDITEEQYKNKYGMTKQSVKKMYEIKDEIGIDKDITSGKLLKNLEMFKEATQIDKFIDELNYSVVEARNTFIGDEYINKIKSAGIKIRDELVEFMKTYEKGLKKTYVSKSKFIGIYQKQEFYKPDYDTPEKRTDPMFFTNNEWDEEKWKKYNAQKKKELALDIKIERIKEDNPIGNYFKLIIKDLFVKTLHNPLIGNYYFDRTGKLTKSNSEIRQIINDRTTFVNDSKLKDYDYNDDKEIGNIYEYFEALVYSQQIATYIKLDILRQTNNSEVADEAYTKIINHFSDNIKSLKIIYGFFTGDVDRIDNVIEFTSSKNIKYTINIETKASGRVSTTSIPSIVNIEKNIKLKLEEAKKEVEESLKTRRQDLKNWGKEKGIFIEDKAKIEKEIKEKEDQIKNIQLSIDKFKSYDMVYTGTKKLLLLIQEYFNGIKNNKPTTFSYNTLYYKKDNDIIGSVRNDKNFNVTPDSASMLSISELVRILELDNVKDKIMKFSSTKKRGRPKVDEEDDEEDVDEENVKDNKAFFNLLRERFEDLKYPKGSLFQLRNYENIYLGIPILYDAEVLYNLKKPVNEISIQDYDDAHLSYIGNLMFKIDKLPTKPKRGQTSIELTKTEAEKYIADLYATAEISDTYGSPNVKGFKQTDIEPPQTPAPAPPLQGQPSPGSIIYFTQPELDLINRLYNLHRVNKKSKAYQRLFKEDEYKWGTIKEALDEATPSEIKNIEKANKKPENRNIPSPGKLNEIDI